MVQDENGVWRMNYEDMEKKIVDKKIHAAIMCSPHNPCCLWIAQNGAKIMTSQLMMWRKPAGMWGLRFRMAETSMENVIYE